MKTVKDQNLEIGRFIGTGKNQPFLRESASTRACNFWVKYYLSGIN